MKSLNNLRKMFWINFFNNLFWLSAVVTFFYIQRGLTFTEILSLSAIMSISVLIFEVPTGMFADKYGRKKSLILSSLFLLFSIFIYLVADNFFLFMISFISLGIGYTFSSGTTEAIIYESVGKNKNNMKRFMGRFMSAEVLAGVISPPIASIIAKDLVAWQFTILIYVTIASYLMGLILVLSLKDTYIKKPHKRVSLLENIKFAKSNRSLIRFVINRSFVAAAMMSFMFLWQPQLKFSGVPIELFGIILAIGSIGIFIVNRNIDRISNKIKVRTSLIASSLIPGLGFLVLAFVFDPVVSIVFYILIRVVSSIREPILSELINKELSNHRRASILSMFALLTSILTFILRPIIGVLSDINLTYGFIGLAVLCFIPIFIFPVKSK